MKKIVCTTNAPEAIGPYSQAIMIDNMLYVSGQIPINPENGEIVGSTMEEQAGQVMKNILAILKEADMDFSHVIKTTCFLADMADFNTFNKVYGAYFTGGPARSCVAVREIPKKVLCEIEVIAYK